MDHSHIHIVVNPIAGSGKAKDVAKALQQKIKLLSVSECQFTFTKEKEDAISITRKAIAEGASLVVSIGGDGTINEVINGFFIDGVPMNDKCELAILDGGTGSSFSRIIHGKRTVNQQIETLFHSKTVALDLGLVNYNDFSGKQVCRIFANECQTGIGTRVVSMVGKTSKLFGGRIAFGFASTIQAIGMKPQKLKIAYDDEPFQKISLLGLVVGNGWECAGGMKLTPDANLTDGFFDVLSISEMGLVKRLLNLSKVYSGKHLLSSGFLVKRCKELKIRSDIKIAFEADGELLGNSPFDIQILPTAIRVRT